jgi:amino-acid N-acetyltransferase
MVQLSELTSLPLRVVDLAVKGNGDFFIFASSHQVGRTEVELRKAKMSDVEAIHSLVNNYANQGLMLPRSRNALYEGVREFTVVVVEDRIVGCGSLHILWSDLAEVRSLAIAPQYTRQGLGRRLVEALVNEARELGIPRILALTYTPAFFAACGFRLATREELPQKVWKECINCPKFPDCDETAMVLELAIEQESA